MKRSRDSEDPEVPQDSAVGGNKRVAPSFHDQPPAPVAVQEDDDPYGFGKVGAPGFVSKPAGMKAGFVPGYLRIPGSSGAMAPGNTALKAAKTNMAGPGARPSPRAGPTAIGPGSVVSQAQSAPPLKPPKDATQHRVGPPSAAPEEQQRHQHNLMLQRKRVQNKDLPEQHRLPDDLPVAGSGGLPKTSASATGPISAQAQPLPGLHAELEAFVEKAPPTKEEKLTKVHHL